MKTSSVGSLAGGGGAGGSLTVAAGQTLSIGALGTSTTFAGNITSGGAGSALTKTGAGTLILTSASAATGGAVTVNGGTLRINASRGFNEGFFTNQDTLVYNVSGGATLEFTGDWNTRSNNTVNLHGANLHFSNAGGINYLNLITMGTAPSTVTSTNGFRGGYFFNPTTTVNAPASGSTISSDLYFVDQAATTDTWTFNVADGVLASDLTISGTIRDLPGWAGLRLIKSGMGTLTLTANNSYSAATTINDGVLQIGNGGTTGSYGGGTLTNNGGLIVNRSNAVSLSGISGSGTLTQGGSGTTTLTGVNSYGGTTYVAGGTLLVDGSTLTAGFIEVSSGAIFGGGGTAGSAILADDAVFSPGTTDLNGSNVIELTGLSLGGTTILRYDLGTPDMGDNFHQDIAKIAGPLTLDGMLRIVARNDGNSSFGSPAIDNRWLLMTYTGALTNNILEVDLAGSTGVPTPASPLYYTIDTSTPGKVYLALVPEAGSGTLVFLGLALLRTFRRKN